MKKGGDGIEAITFVPDAGHPHGGSFYVANQSKDLASTDDISAIFELEMPLNESDKNGSAEIKRHFCIGTIDLAGLHYDQTSGNLLVVSDKMNTIFEVSTAGKTIKSHPLPGINQEGVTIDAEGFMYIAQDSGGIIKIKRAVP